MNNILLIGGNGFIGSHILDELLNNNKKVKIFDKTFEKYRSPFKEVEYVLADFSDTLALTESLTDIDCVIHSLSTSIPSSSNKFPIQDINGNLIATINLLDTMISKGVKRIVFLSSGGTVYGIPKYSPVKETHETEPICSYGIVKLAIEKYLFMYSKLNNLEPIILRISNPFGPRQSHIGTQGFISTLISNYLKNNITTIYGNGAIVRDYIFISDVAKACYIAANSSLTGVFNVGSNVGYSLANVINIFEEIIGEKVQVKYIDKRLFDIPEIVLDTEKFTNAFNWKTSVPIKSGIQMHFDWLKTF